MSWKNIKIGTKMVERQEDYLVQWHRNEDDTATIEQIYGKTPYVQVPERVAGLPVSRMEDYCFSQKAQSELPQEEIPFGMTRLCGKYIVEVVLPEGLVHLGNYAFYNCMALECVSFPAKYVTVGSDAFMNCMHLNRMVYRGSVQQENCLRAVLAQISWDLQVDYLDASIFFPEFDQHYDEIGPAHIFAINVNGEGYRTRQCFENQKFKFDQYDEIFPQACIEESERTLCAMAMNRLLVPYELSQTARAQYVEYITAHQDYVLQNIMKERDIKALEAFLALELVVETELSVGIAKASALEWGEGTVTMMKYKKTHFEKKASERFSFDDFD